MACNLSYQHSPVLLHITMYVDIVMIDFKTLLTIRVTALQYARMI